METGCIAVSPRFLRKVKISHQRCHHHHQSRELVIILNLLPPPLQGHHRPALPDLLGPPHPPARLRANATSYVCQHPGFTTVKWSLRVRHGYIWYGLVLNSLVSPVTPFDRLPSAILLNLLVVVGHSADLPQLLLPWLPYGKHGWEKGNSETMLTIFWE